MKQLGAIVVKTGVILLVAVALTVSALRLAFPYLNDFRPSIIHYIEQYSGQTVQIGYLEGEWLSFGPALKIKGLHIANPSHYVLDVDEITLELDVWQSLLNFRWQFRELTFYRLGLNLFVDENRAEQVSLTSFNIEPNNLSKLFLRRLNYFDLKESQIAFTSPSGAPVSLHIPQLTWLNKRQRHQAEGEVTLSGMSDYHGTLKVIADLYDEGGGYLNRGMVYLQADDVNMAPWLNRWVRHNTGINSANFSLASWIRIDNSDIAEGYLKLDNGKVNWWAGESEQRLTIDNQWLHLTQQGSGWLLDIPELNVYSNGEAWPQSDISLYWQPEDNKGANGKNGAEILRIRATMLQLEYLKPILPIFTFLDPERLAPFLDLDPQGYLETLALDIPLAQPEKIAFLASWQDVSWQPWRGLPGMENLSGDLAGNSEKGRIQISLVNSVLPYEQVFRAPLEIEQASGEFYWRSDDSLWKLWSSAVDVQAHSLWVNGNFAFSSSPQYGDWLSILGGVHLYDAKEAWRYYPEPLMGEDLVDYLTEAIQGGHGSNGTLIFEGDPKEFPFEHNNGRFQAFALLEDATLQFQPTWLPLTHLTVELDFIGEGLWMRADDAQLMNVVVSDISAAIPVYDEEMLYLDSTIRGAGSDVYNYLKDSPLRTSVAAALEEIQISGEVSGRLQLDIPLTDEEMVDVRGVISLENNEVLIRPVEIELSNVHGNVSFDNHELNGRELRADWLGQPISMNFTTRMRGDDYLVNVGLNGTWLLDKLSFIPTHLANDFKGRANWRSDLAITLPDKGLSRYEISLKGRVDQVSEHLSSLLVSKRGDPITVTLAAKGDTDQFTLSGNIDSNYLNSLWRLEPQRLQIARGIWQVGANRIPDLPINSELLISLPEVNGDYWLPLLTALASNREQVDTSLPELTLAGKVTLNSPVLTFAGQHWRQLTISIDNVVSLFNVESKELTATATQHGRGPWQLDIDHLYYNPVWPASDSTRGTAKQNVAITSFRHWPELMIRCDDCWFMGQNLGRLEADLVPSGNSLKLAHGLIDTDNTQLQVTGEWYSSPQGVHSAFKGSLTGDRFDQSMRHFGILTPLRNAPFTVNFDTRWQGEPWQPQIETLSGVLSSQFASGRIAHMGGGTAGQILRLVSVTSLLKRLRHDFSDSFGDDFDFDSITATINIRQGVLATDNMLMNGSSADIAMRGTLDLVRQTINMEAVVAPELSATVGVAAAFAINPVAGVAVFAASKVLSPLWNKVSFIRYRITGNLDNPEVSETLRQAHNQ